MKEEKINIYITKKEKENKLEKKHYKNRCSDLFSDIQKFETSLHFESNKSFKIKYKRSKRVSYSFLMSPLLIS